MLYNPKPLGKSILKKKVHKTSGCTGCPCSIAECLLPLQTDLIAVGTLGTFCTLPGWDYVHSSGNAQILGVRLPSRCCFTDPWRSGRNSPTFANSILELSFVYLWGEMFLQQCISSDLFLKKKLFIKVYGNVNFIHNKNTFTDILSIIKWAWLHAPGMTGWMQCEGGTANGKLMEINCNG